MKKKVKHIGQPTEWKSKQGFVNYYFDIEFTDGERGQFGSQKKEQNKFIEGNEYDVKVVRQSPKGVNTYDIIKEERSFGMTAEERERMLRGSAMKSTIEYLQLMDVTEVKPQYIAPLYAKFHHFVDKEHTRSSCAALHDAIALASIVSLKIGKSDDVIKVAEMLYNNYVDGAKIVFESDTDKTDY